MVHLGEAMKAEKKKFFIGLARAKDLFFEVATIPPGEHEPVIDFDQFTRLIAMILRESNAEAAKKDKPPIPIPSKSSLRALFCEMDSNNSSTIDEYEFIGLYKAVRNGRHVKGVHTSDYHFYARPHQLMNWGDHDYHPNTDWQDLFFDLLFVGGAYQTGNFLVNALVANDEHMLEAVVWSFCLFTTLAQQWLMKILLGSRFSHSSMFHYLLDNFEFILLAFAMWHIPASPLYIRIEKDDASYSSYGDDDGARRLAASTVGFSSEDYDSFSCLDQLKYNIHGRTGGFSLSLCLVSLIYLFKWLEIYFNPEATDGAVVFSKFQAQGYAACSFILLLAFFVSKHETYSMYVCWIWVVSNCAYLTNLCNWVFFMRVKKKAGRLDQAGVPMSTNYFIQRVGEFCMLIIGESVLSLLALSVEPEYENYLMFGASAIIACNLYFHHFSTYPPDPSQHVLYDGTFDFPGFCYSVALIYLYPFCVVHIGVCLKALLSRAEHKSPLDFINWAIAIGICVEYILINFFVFIHFKSRPEDEQWKPFATTDGIFEFFENLILKGLSMVLVLSFAGFGLQPFNMVMLCCLGLLFQSGLEWYLHPRSTEYSVKDEDLEMAEMDFKYHTEKLQGNGGGVVRKGSFTLYAINSVAKMRTMARDRVKKNAIANRVSPSSTNLTKQDVDGDNEEKEEGRRVQPNRFGYRSSNVSSLSNEEASCSSFNERNVSLDQAVVDIDDDDRKDRSSSAIKVGASDEVKVSKVSSGTTSLSEENDGVATSSPSSDPLHSNSKHNHDRGSIESSAIATTVTSTTRNHTAGLVFPSTPPLNASSINNPPSTTNASASNSPKFKPPPPAHAASKVWSTSLDDISINTGASKSPRRPKSASSTNGSKNKLTNISSSSNSSRSSVGGVVKNKKSEDLEKDDVKKKKKKPTIPRSSSSQQGKSEAI